MPAAWTGDVVKDLHLHGISAKRLAEKLGWHSKYLSTVMNGHKNPAGAEQKIRAALDELIKEG